MTTPTNQDDTSNADADWQPNNRPQSTLARNFSAALDDLFKLNGIGALEDSVEQKKDVVQSQKYQLDNLNAKLREADDRLRRLEAKHRRQSQMLAADRHGRPQLTSQFPGSAEGDESSGDSDAQERASSQDDESMG